MKFALSYQHIRAPEPYDDPRHYISGKAIHNAVHNHIEDVARWAAGELLDGKRVGEFDLDDYIDFMFDEVGFNDFSEYAYRRIVTDRDVHLAEKMVQAIMLFGSHPDAYDIALEYLVEN